MCSLSLESLETPPGQLLPAVRRPCGCHTVTSFVTFQVLVERLLCAFGTKTSILGLLELYGLGGQSSQWHPVSDKCSL